MPIYKRCSRCGRRIEVSSKCSCVDKRYAEQRKAVNKDRENKFYFTQEWKDVRQIAIDRYFALDIYSYYIDGIIEFGETVHHIVPLKDDWNKRIDIKNLIFLTESNHQKIHSMMKQSEAEKRKIIAQLEMLVNRFRTEFYA